MAMAARMPMMATTIMSSISVKPLEFFFMCSPVRERPGAMAGCGCHPECPRGPTPVDGPLARGVPADARQNLAETWAAPGE
jgi:hypothetical protein